MAFISDKHELVFVHIPKNAGTSISDALSRLHETTLIQNKPYINNGVGNGVPPEYRPNGIDVHDTLDEIHQKYPKSENYKAFAVIRNPFDRIYSFYKHKLRRGDRDMPYGTFSEVMRKSNVLLLQPQLWWVGNNDCHFLRFEELETDYNDFMADYDAPALERLNVDVHPDDYRNHYDSYSQSLIYEYYRHEIEAFGYEF